MGPERWRRVRELFEEGLEKPEGERSRWLAATCGDDAELVERVQGLLAADARARVGALDERLERALGVVAGELTVAVDDPQTRIGRWRAADGGALAAEVVDQDGRSGRLGWVEAEGEEGFGVSDHFRLWKDLERRRGRLDGLDHPALVRVLDVGVTDEGRVWVVTEAVEGRSLSRYLLDEAIDRAGRLDLLDRVAAALEWCHAHLLPHGDLSASEVLVDPAGRVRLQGFGVAFLLGRASASSTTSDLDGLVALAVEVLGEDPFAPGAASVSGLRAQLRPAGELGFRAEGLAFLRRHRPASAVTAASLFSIGWILARWVG